MGLERDVFFLKQFDLALGLLAEQTVALVVHLNLLEEFGLARVQFEADGLELRGHLIEVRGPRVGRRLVVGVAGHPDIEIRAGLAGRGVQFAAIQQPPFEFLR